VTQNCLKLQTGGHPEPPKAAVILSEAFFSGVEGPAFRRLSPSTNFGFTTLDHFTAWLGF
jgi:hypothetical protein